MAAGGGSRGKVLVLILGAVIAALALSAAPASAVFPGANGLIAYDPCCEGSAGIFAVPPTGGDPVQLTTGSDNEPSWSADGGHLVFVRENQSLVTMDLDGGHETEVVHSVRS